jgi:glycosyltransferase involved in cell wall biosynthesis
MAIVLFTTTDLRGARQADFHRLLSCIERSHGVDIRHYILLQGCTDDALRDWKTAAPAVCRLFAVSGGVSLSEARNRLIASALAEAPAQHGDVVAFPDDDCWFPDGFLERLAQVFASREALDLLICRMAFDPEASPFDAADVAPVSARKIVRMSSSNNMFLRGSLMAALGLFDHGLGLGTAAGGGEDTDYVVRAFLRARQSGLIDRALVGHAPPDQGSAAKYFQGALIVLARHARSRPALAAECLRKVLVGLYFTSRGQLSVSGYAGALQQGVRSFLIANSRGQMAP